MNIIRHGDSEILEKMHMNIYFKCDACHCCFEANCSEYSVQMYRNPTTYLHYTINCPDCNQKITKELLYENLCDSEKPKTEF